MSSEMHPQSHPPAARAEAETLDFFAEIVRRQVAVDLVGDTLQAPHQKRVLDLVAFQA